MSTSNKNTNNSIQEKLLKTANTNGIFDTDGNIYSVQELMNELLRGRPLAGEKLYILHDLSNNSKTTTDNSNKETNYEKIIHKGETFSIIIIDPISMPVTYFNPLIKYANDFADFLLKSCYKSKFEYSIKKMAITYSIYVLRYTEESDLSDFKQLLNPSSLYKFLSDQDFRNKVLNCCKEKMSKDTCPDKKFLTNILDSCSFFEAEYSKEDSLFYDCLKDVSIKLKKLLDSRYSSLLTFSGIKDDISNIDLSSSNVCIYLNNWSHERKTTIEKSFTRWILGINSSSWDI